MTHDELLAKINNFIYSTNRLEDASQECDCAICKLQKSFNEALRAVVELHKPDIPYGLHDAVEACPIDGDVYPCSTIQAIEKALEHSTES